MDDVAGPTRALVRLALITGASAVAASLALAGPASASIAGTATLTLSGAVHGTVHEGPSGICTNARGNGVDILGLQGAVAGSHAGSWTFVLEATAGKAGTYKIANGVAGGQLDPIAKHPTLTSSEKSLINATHGTFTFSGYKGSANVAFGTGKKAITVKGSWNCRG
jgi:hypothetical protein